MLNCLSKILVLLVTSLVASTSLLSAQGLIVHQETIVVPIYNENLVRARKEALKRAKKQVLRGVLEQKISTEVLDAAEPFLKSFWKNPDRFIDSIRVLNEKTSVRLTQFSLLIEAKVLGRPLFAAARAQYLPLKQDPIQVVSFLYDIHEPLWQTVPVKEVLQQLSEVLPNYRIELHDTQGMTSLMAEELQLPDTAIDPQWVGDLYGEAPFLTWDLMDASESMQSVSSRNQKRQSRFALYDPNGQLLHESIIHHTVPVMAGPKQATAFVDQLQQQWFPTLQELWSYETTRSAITVEIIGLPGPEQEQRLMTELFYNDPLWEKLTLHRLKANSTVYAGYYQGSHDALPDRLESMVSPNYQIQEVLWEQQQLTVTVQWFQKATPLETYQEIAAVSEWLESQTPDSQEEPAIPGMMTSKSSDSSIIYSLPIDSWTHDYLQTRDDSTTYQLHWVQPQQTLWITWHRIGKTNLNPVISLYSSNYERLQQYFLEDKESDRIQYQVPEGVQGLLIRVADRIGYIQDDAQSFRSMRYVIRVEAELPFSEAILP